MGFRMRRSIQLMPGVRLNMSKTGIGYSVGVKGFRVSQGADGKVRQTMSLPGTGISHVTTLGSSATRQDGNNDGASGSGQPDAALAEPNQTASGIRKPGLLAPKAHKLLADAFIAGEPPKVDAVGYSNDRVSLAAATLAGFLYLDAQNLERSGALLAWAFATGKDPERDEFISQYVQTMLDLQVVPGTTVKLAINRNAVGLALAEVLQAQGQLAEAALIVEQLVPDSVTALSLADLYVALGRFGDAVKLTEGLGNSDDLTALLCVFRGIAFREQGYFDAARLALKEALRFRSRHPVVRHRAWLERARCYEQEGKRSLARKDLERILAEDSTYPGLTEALDELG